MRVSRFQSASRLHREFPKSHHRFLSYFVRVALSSWNLTMRIEAQGWSVSSVSDESDCWKLLLGGCLNFLISGKNFV